MAKNKNAVSKEVNNNVEVIVPKEVNDQVEVIQAVEPAVVESAVLVVQSTAPVSKAQVANAIFKQMFAMEQVPARKDMIKRAMNEAKLTEKGAATYLQNFKSKNGLVKKATA